MATRIKHVTIKKLWGIKDISTDFDEHANIFIGHNGSSKTTFLNLIEAVLLCDMEIFNEIDFESIQIILGEEEPFEIRVSKANEEEYVKIIYDFIPGFSYEMACTEAAAYRPRYSLSQRKAMSMIQEELSKHINISWLSINRGNSVPTERDVRFDPDRFRNMVDVKLRELVKRLGIYQLQLEQEANKSASKFKEECLSLMLFNESFDNPDPRNIKSIEKTDTASMKEDLLQAFEVLGVKKDKKTQIDIHIAKIKDVMSKISTTEDLSLEDIFILSLINRTLSIIEISKVHESQTKEIFAPIEKLWRCLKGFMPEKRFEFNTDNDGDLIVLLTEDREKPVSIGVTSLSSGEKQLFILMAEALLQKNMPHIFIADEPELSLHIAWQRRIISAIMDLNPNAQIIVATHSPEVAAYHRTNLINMKAITSYE